MSPSPSTKAQLGARVPHEVLALADKCAARANVSRNVWVERAIRRAAASEGLLSSDLIFDGEPASAVATATDAAESGGAGTSPAPSKPFSPDCSMREYHWRCTPQNPCRRCGGTT